MGKYQTVAHQKGREIFCKENALGCLGLGSLFFFVLQISGLFCISQASLHATVQVTHSRGIESDESECGYLGCINVGEVVFCLDFTFQFGLCQASIVNGRLGLLQLSALYDTRTREHRARNHIKQCTRKRKHMAVLGRDLLDFQFKLCLGQATLFVLMPKGHMSHTPIRK